MGKKRKICFLVIAKGSKFDCEVSHKYRDKIRWNTQSLTVPYFKRCFIVCCYCVLYCSGPGSCLLWSGVCLCVTTVPEGTSGRTVSSAVLDSYKPSWQTVKDGHCKWVDVCSWRYSKSMWIILCICQGFGPLLAHGYLGSEWAALPPPVAVWVSDGFTLPLAAPPSLDPGSGGPAAGSISEGTINLQLS